MEYCEPVALNTGDTLNDEYGLNLAAFIVELKITDTNNNCLWSAVECAVAMLVAFSRTKTSLTHRGRSNTKCRRRNSRGEMEYSSLDKALEPFSMLTVCRL